MMYRVLFLLIIGTSVIGMQPKKKVKIPTHHKKHIKAKKVLNHAGYGENETKINALVHAFNKMERDPELKVHQVTEQDPLNESGRSPKEAMTRFEYVKYLWDSYHQTAKVTRRVEVSQDDGENATIEGGGDDEIVREQAKELVDNALDLFADQQSAAVVSQKRQRNIAIALGFVATITGTVLSAYWNSRCQNS